MSIVDSTLHVPKPSRASAYIDVLQMLTGAFLVIFMWGHMMLVSSVLLGTGVMTGVAEFFESTYLVQTGGPITAMGFMLHFVMASRKVPFNLKEQRSIWAHAKMFQHRDTWLWVIQAFTAMFILVLGSIHMWEVLTNLPITAFRSAERVQSGWVWLYLVLLPMVELHVGIGFYRIGVKWGFIKRENRAMGKKLEFGISAFFIVLGLITLIRYATLTIPASPVH